MNITWYYNEKHHGKGLMDGIGGTLIGLDVMSGKSVTDTPKPFVEHADKA